MKRRQILINTMMSFFVCTTCIGIVMGVLGVILLPDSKFGYEAYFAPPIFGIISAVLSLLMNTSKEISKKQSMIRKIILLFLIELVVFLINFAAGSGIDTKAAAAVAVSVAVVFAVVNIVLWLNDSRSAKIFNQELKKFQEREHIKKQPG